MATYIVNLLRDHPKAPRFREGLPLTEPLRPEHEPLVRGFDESIGAAAKDGGLARVILRETVRGTVERARERCGHYRRTLAGAARVNFVEDTAGLPVCGRADLAQGADAFVPDDAPLADLVLVQAPSPVIGGAPVAVPLHPAALATTSALLRAVLRRRGIAFEPAPDLCAVMRVELQSRFAQSGAEVGFAASLAGAGHARFDLDASQWRDRLDAPRYVAAFAPAVLAGGGAALERFAGLTEELERQEPRAPKPRVRAVLASALEPLTRSARERVERAFGAPCIDWLSLAETGPVAYGCASGRGLHLLAPDLHVESIGPRDQPGDLVATGGRNPFLPLVRYRLGARGRIDGGPCACGDASPRLTGVERAP